MTQPGSHPIRKAIVTYGTGPVAEVLALALPTFTEYAMTHNYDVIIGSGTAEGRHPAWGKIPLLQQVLRSYDFALWLDADTLILDGSVDVETLIPRDASQAYAITVCQPGAGTSPCTGVWALRAGMATRELLDEIWAQADLAHDRWWEQSALMRISGWTTAAPFLKVAGSRWDSGTFILPEEWDIFPTFRWATLPAGSGITPTSQLGRANLTCGRIWRTSVVACHATGLALRSGATDTSIVRRCVSRGT